MGYCTSCGHPLGVGRFCTSCSHPVAAPPERTTGPTPPGGRRSRLRPATTAARRASRAGPAPPATRSSPTRAPTTPPPAGPPGTSRPRPLPGGTLAAPWPHPGRAPPALVALARAGGRAGPRRRRARRVSALSGDDAHPRRATTGLGRPQDGRDRRRRGLDSRSTVEVPATAPPNQDTAGQRTTYDGDNLLDGVPETCWRMPGDGTGEAHRDPPGPHPPAQRRRHQRLREDRAGCRGRELDWYHGNRRVLAVEWVFDDGTTVPQQLEDTTAVRSVDVDVTTTTVVLRLVEVSPPGRGPAARDYTAISDLSLVAG